MIRRTGLLDRTVQQRSAALHYVATEDTHAPAAYFVALERLGITDVARTRVVPVETRDGASSPARVVRRLREHLDRLDRVEDFDGRWVLIDEDHHFTGGHQGDLARALQEARSIGATVLVSAPCFEVWLLAHAADLPAEALDTRAVQASLRAACPGWTKERPVERLLLDGGKVRAAVARCRERPLAEGRPVNPGTELWRLVAALLPGEPGP